MPRSVAERADLLAILGEHLSEKYFLASSAPVGGCAITIGKPWHSMQIFRMRDRLASEGWGLANFDVEVAAIRPGCPLRTRLVDFWGIAFAMLRRSTSRPAGAAAPRGFD
jgi:hypothetical protein